MNRKQFTIKEVIDIEGVGIHTGKKSKLFILPANCNDGILFEIDGKIIKSTVDNVVSTARCTTIGREGIIINTVEHLLAACSGLEIDNLLVKMNGEEIPILDGSSKVFADLLVSAGKVELSEEISILEIQEKVLARYGDIFYVAMPADKFSMTVVVDYNNPLIGMQIYTYSPDRDNFIKDLAPARTFAFKKEVEHLLKAGLGRGGSLDNAVIVDEDSYMNPLRFEDEIVRHKALDLLGDLTLINKSIKGHIFAYKPGHKFNVEFVKSLVKKENVWKSKQNQYK